MPDTSLCCVRIMRLNNLAPFPSLFMNSLANDVRVHHLHAQTTSPARLVETGLGLGRNTQPHSC